MSKQNTIAKVSFAIALDKQFDYLIPSNLIGKIEKGARVKVLFNRKEMVGYVVGLARKSKIDRLNKILELIDKYPILTSSALEMANRIKDYYVCSLGEAIQTMLPSKLRNVNNIFKTVNSKKDLNKNKAKEIFYLQALSTSDFFSSCKDVILEKIRNKKRIIIVVHRIEKTKDVLEYLKNFVSAKTAILHGRIAKKEVINLWKDLTEDNIDILIGTRSSIFSPINNLGLIIVVDEDSRSHKDDQVPYYHSVDIALMRSEIDKCDVILSSIIPSSKVYGLISKKKIALKESVKLRATAEVSFTQINFKDKIDIILQQEINNALERKEKILAFCNRKGFANFIYCNKCKEALKCNRCSKNLRFDYSGEKFICSSCSFVVKSSEICPKCNSSYIKFGGLGIERLESNLKKYFPQAKIIILDELSKSGSNPENFDIIIATQKILNFNNFKPDITIVWNFDELLNIGDYLSAEENYQLIVKLLLMTTKKMIICTSFAPDYYLFRSLKNLDFNQFYEEEFRSRKLLKLPPFYHLGLISIRGLNKINVQNTSQRLYACFKKQKDRDSEISNPYSTFRSRLREKYYKYILVRSKSIKKLNNKLKTTINRFKSNGIIITANIDPI